MLETMEKENTIVNALENIKCGVGVNYISKTSGIPKSPLQSRLKQNDITKVM